MDATTGEFSPGLCSWLTFPLERLVELQKSLLCLLHRVSENLMVLIDFRKCLVWSFLLNFMLFALSVKRLDRHVP